jgi:hypothetical protein
VSLTRTCVIGGLVVTNFNKVGGEGGEEKSSSKAFGVSVADRHKSKNVIPRGARVSSISSRGDGLDPNLLYPPLEEEGLPLFPQFSQKLLNKCYLFHICRNIVLFFNSNISSIKFGFRGRRKIWANI